MPTTDPRYTTGRLAALDGLGLELPPAVTRAIAAFRAAGQLEVPAPRRPGILTRQASIAEADRLARKAAESSRPSFDLGDLSAITAARAQEVAAADRQALAEDLRDASARLLGQVVAENAGELVAAIQARHGQVMDGLRERARRLPPGADEVSALQEGGRHREDFLGARDAVAEVGQLRDAIRLVDDRTPPEPVDGMSMCVGWEKTGRLAGTWLAPFGTTTHGDLGSLAFWLSAAREDSYELWLPTAAEQAGRLAELRAERQAERARAAAL
jgi:hypothetical protein